MILIKEISVLMLRRKIKALTENLILNLGTGVGYSVFDIIDRAGKVTGETISHKVTARRHGDPSQLIAVSELAKDKIGFECKYSDIETILESMWNVYNNQKSVC